MIETQKEQERALLVGSGITADRLILTNHGGESKS